MVNIFYARESISKEKFIFERIRESGGKTIVVVPDQYKLECEKQAMKLLETSTLLDVEITGLSGIGEKAVKIEGNHRSHFLKKSGRHMLISEILRQNEGDMSVFVGYSEKTGFIEKLDDLISGMKRENVSSELLKTLYNNVASKRNSEIKPDDGTMKKLHDFLRIFENYEEIMGNAFVDGEDMIAIYAEKIRASEILRDRTVWIYGFDSFTANNFKIIDSIISTSMDTNFFFTYDGSTGGELFSLTRRMLEKIELIATEANVATKRTQVKADEISRKQGILTLEREIFAEDREYIDCLHAGESNVDLACEGTTEDDGINARKSGIALADGTETVDKYSNSGASASVDAQAEAAGLIDRRDRWEDAYKSQNDLTQGNYANDIFDGIEIYECENAYNEIENAAIFIIELLRDKRYTPSDVAVITNDKEVIGKSLPRIFQEYGLEVFEDKKIRAAESPFAEFALSMVQTVRTGYSVEAIFRALKTDILEIPKADIEMLEIYAEEYHIKGKMWLRSFEKGLSKYGADELAKLEEIRKSAMEPFLVLEEIYKGSETYEEFIRGYYRFLNDYIGLPEKVRNESQRQRNGGQEHRALVTLQIWSALINSLDQMMLIMGEKKFSGAVFCRLLERALISEEIAIIPPSENKIVVGTMQRTRLSDVKALIVLGANEGILPMRNDDTELLSGEEMKSIADASEIIEEGLNINDMVENVITQEEKIAIYRNLVKPTEHLFMSYAKTDADGNEVFKSEIITEIEEIFPGLSEKADPVRSDDVIRLAGDNIATRRHFISRSDENEVNPLWDVVGESLSQAEKMDYLRSRKNMDLISHEDIVNAEISKELFKDTRNEISDAYRFSPSRIEKFARCPFSHFISYGLRPREIREYAGNGREIGDLYHEILMQTTQTIEEQHDWERITEEEVLNLLEDVAVNVAKKYREGLFTSAESEQYKAKRAIKVLQNVMLKILQQHRDGSIEHSFYEAEFMNGKDFDAIDLTVGTEHIKIEGKIDRVDFLKSGYHDVIDYKTGKEQFDVDEARAGYRLQLMVYLRAVGSLSESKPAGVFYFNIAEELEDVTKNKIAINIDELSKKVEQTLKLNGIMLSDANVVRDIAGELEPGDTSSIVEGITVKSGCKSERPEYVSRGEIPVISDTEFQSIIADVDYKIEELCSRMLNGDIKAFPMYTKDKKTPCDYCDYSHICGFDSHKDYYNYIRKP